MTAVLNGIRPSTLRDISSFHLATGRLAPSEITGAVELLGEWIRSRAAIVSARLSIDPVAVEDAPDTFDKLRAAFRRSLRTGEPLPVSSLHCERTIYNTPELNHLLRFIHDIQHVERGCDFSPVQEIDMGWAHLDDLVNFGAPRGSVAWRLLHADLIGQTYCSALLGFFPEDQKRFDLNVVELGLDQALIIAAELQGDLR